MENTLSVEVENSDFEAGGVHDARKLLRALWRTEVGNTFVGAMTAMGNAKYRQLSVTTVDEAVNAIQAWKDEGLDCYFGVSEYVDGSERTAVNVKQSSGFWVDIDCGQHKAGEEKGYVDIDEAKANLDEFCLMTSIPKPTHIVSSGGGLHAYWILTEPVGPEEWLPAAQKLKAVMKTLGFRADPSRTCDRASNLRVPGTMNYKYQPPRPVVLEKANSSFIPRQQMLDAIKDAHEAYCPTVTVAKESPARSYSVPTMQTLRAALSHLDPDCEEVTWKFRRMAPLARLASDQPDMADELRELAQEWSRGALQDSPSKAWRTVSTSSGKSGEAVFAEVWQRFLTDKASSVKTSLGSLFHDAAEAGWEDPKAGGAEVHKTESSRETLIKEAQQRALVAIERCKGGDQGAPFEADAIAAMATLSRLDNAELVRVKAQLKATGRSFSVTDLNTAIRNHVKTAKATAPTHHGYGTDTLDGLTVDGHRAVAYQGVLYVVDPTSGLWVEHTKSALGREITKRHDGKDNCTRYIDYKSIAEQVFSIAEDETFFQSAAGGIACNGVFYRADGGKVVQEPLRPEHRPRVMLKFDVRNQPTPLFDAFMHETFRSEVEGEEDQQRTLMQELAGAIFLGLMAQHQKAMIWLDPYGRAGKGTLMSILENLVPKDFVSAVSPVLWHKEFYLISLAGKRLNVVGELPEDQYIPAADFKSVIGRDLLSARHPMGRPISFRNEAAHVFMSNHPLGTKDHTEAFYSRFILSEFPNSRTVSGAPIDPGTSERIIKSEMSGIAYWALEGAKRLLQQGKFSSSKVHDRLMADWRRKSSALEEFIHECCVLGEKHKVNRSTFYESFRTWCSENGRKPSAKSRVTAQLEHNMKLGVKLAKLDGYDIFRGLQLKANVPSPATAFIPRADDAEQAPVENPVF